MKPGASTWMSVVLQPSGKPHSIKDFAKLQRLANREIHRALKATERAEARTTTAEANVEKLQAQVKSLTAEMARQGGQHQGYRAVVDSARKKLWQDKVIDLKAELE